MVHDLVNEMMEEEEWSCSCDQSLGSWCTRCITLGGYLTWLAATPAVGAATCPVWCPILTFVKEAEGHEFTLRYCRTSNRLDVETCLGLAWEEVEVDIDDCGCSRCPAANTCEEGLFACVALVMAVLFTPWLALACPVTPVALACGPAYEKCLKTRCFTTSLPCARSQAQRGRSAADNERKRQLTATSMWSRISSSKLRHELLQYLPEHVVTEEGEKLVFGGTRGNGVMTLHSTADLPALEVNQDCLLLGPVAPESRFRGRMAMVSIEGTLVVPQGLVAERDLFIVSKDGIGEFGMNVVVHGNLVVRERRNKLEELPDDLTVSNGWDLSGCKSLRSLPQGMAEVGGSLKLQGCSNLVELPVGLTNVSGTLDLTDCTSLRWLPPQLTVRGDLILKGCTSLSSLPSTLQVYGRLLDLRDCTALNGLPVEPFLHQRSAFLVVNMEGTSEGVRQAANEYRRWDLVENVSFLVGDLDQFVAEGQTREAGLQNLVDVHREFGVAPEDLQPYIDRAYLPGVLQFLTRLMQSQEFLEPALRPGLQKRVKEVLQTISDPAVCEEMVIRMIDSLDTCNDKPIFALGQMNVVAEIARARGDAAAVRALGRRIMRLNIVHEHVERLIKKFGGHSRTDDVCVYLRFEIALREPLDLPVSSSAMIYHSYVNVKEEHIAAARQEALGVSEEEFEAWLSGWDEWHRQLRFDAVIPFEELKESSQEAPAGEHLDLSGFPNGDPVYVLPSTSDLWSYHDFCTHWVATGKDFSNNALDAKDLATQVLRVPGDWEQAKKENLARRKSMARKHGASPKRWSLRSFGKGSEVPEEDQGGIAITVASFFTSFTTNREGTPVESVSETARRGVTESDQLAESALRCQWSVCLALWGHLAVPAPGDCTTCPDLAPEGRSQERQVLHCKSLAPRASSPQSVGGVSLQCGMSRALTQRASAAAFFLLQDDARSLARHTPLPRTSAAALPAPCAAAPGASSEPQQGLDEWLRQRGPRGLAEAQKVTGMSGREQAEHARRRVREQGQTARDRAKEARQAAGTRLPGRSLDEDEASALRQREGAREGAQAGHQHTVEHRLGSKRRDNKEGKREMEEICSTELKLTISTETLTQNVTIRTPLAIHETLPRTFIGHFFQFMCVPRVTRAAAEDKKREQDMKLISWIENANTGETGSKTTAVFKVPKSSTFYQRFVEEQGPLAIDRTIPDSVYALPPEKGLSCVTVLAMRRVERQIALEHAKNWSFFQDEEQDEEQVHDQGKAENQDQDQFDEEDDDEAEEDFFDLKNWPDLGGEKIPEDVKRKKRIEELKEQLEGARDQERYVRDLLNRVEFVVLELETDLEELTKLDVLIDKCRERRQTRVQETSEIASPLAKPKHSSTAAAETKVHGGEDSSLTDDDPEELDSTEPGAGPALSDIVLEEPKIGMIAEMDEKNVRKAVSPRKKKKKTTKKKRVQKTAIVIPSPTPSSATKNKKRKSATQGAKPASQVARKRNTKRPKSDGSPKAPSARHLKWQRSRSIDQHLERMKRGRAQAHADRGALKLAQEERFLSQEVHFGHNLRRNPRHAPSSTA
ncbi:E3 ubiquitin-protein ligase SspH1 (RING-type E3 ubiquitin transferase SspH1) (Salmonella secreted protein H1) (Secreted effector protein SspH1) [Durusdinium trenchii]|uniref:E3 ubiquitin-protein ligase SspH1 (RING-type E3 ubiquitin transferase SspH1) (Salmonella secreted protein H1) (Secreted effector protein SspH1) n=1 Tax=Durusdinium trenchii TaxID=1381693 RepID=A0ABP0SJ89_9DINO